MDRNYTPSKTSSLNDHKTASANMDADNLPDHHAPGNHVVKNIMSFSRSLSVKDSAFLKKIEVVIN